MTTRQNNVRYGRPAAFSQGNCQSNMMIMHAENVAPRPDTCNKSFDMLAGIPIAMAYVPWQTWHNIYDSCKAFERGTIFEELDKPFLGQRRMS